MIQEIKSCKELIPYLRDKIEDEKIEVEIEDNLREEQYAIIKVDDFYNNLHIASPPKSIDFVVTVDCECFSYVLYLLELKNVNSPKKLNIRDIQEKFSTTIHDFLTERFGHIFLNDKYKYKDIKLYLVSDAYGLSENYETYEEYRKIQDKKQRIQSKDSLRVDCNLASRLYKFKGKIVKINYDIPPNPIIRKFS